MLNLKLGLAALGMEASAWTTVALLYERSDAALAGYLLLHALACVLLSLTLLPLLRQRPQAQANRRCQSQYSGGGCGPWRPGARGARHVRRRHRGGAASAATTAWMSTRR